MVKRKLKNSIIILFGIKKESFQVKIIIKFINTNNIIICNGMNFITKEKVNGFMNDNYLI